jgi:hypothetical protein
MKIERLSPLPPVVCLLGLAVEALGQHQPRNMEVVGIDRKSVV